MVVHGFTKKNPAAPLTDIASCIMIGSNAGVSEPGFLNFFARDVWRALSVPSITMKQ